MARKSTPAAEEPKTDTPEKTEGGWFHNLAATEVTILHKIGTFVIKAGDAVLLPFKAEHRDLVEVSETAGKQIAAHAAEEAAAAEKAAKADVETDVHTVAEEVADKTTSATTATAAAAETPKE